MATNLFFIDFKVFIYLVILIKFYFTLKWFWESKTEILVKTTNNIILVYFVIIRLLVILFITKLYVQKNIFNIFAGTDLLNSRKIYNLFNFEQ